MIKINKFSVIWNFIKFLFFISIVKTTFAQSSLSDVCKNSYDGISYVEDYKNEPILAEDNGIVKVVSNRILIGPYQNCDQYVVIMHKNPNGKIVYTRYGEIRTNLKTGENIKKGAIIGYAGKTGEWYFETRPVKQLINNKIPYWDIVRTTDPQKFDWKTYNSNYLNTPLAPTSWNRYKATDLNDLISDSLRNFNKEGSSIKIFLDMPAYRMSVSLENIPFKCNVDQILEPFIKAPVRIGNLKLPESSYCIKVRSLIASNNIITMPVQDSVAFEMLRQFQRGDELEIYAVHLFMQGINGKVGKIGFMINTYNALFIN